MEKIPVMLDWKLFYSFNFKEINNIMVDQKKKC